MIELGWIDAQRNQVPTAKIPLQFNFPPVEVITKELTKLNANHPYRISYLGPRWENSVIFHKKYSKNGAYPFKESKYSKASNFLYQSMTHNQFYKNQFYYRAFEGMNPTLNLQEELIFQSRFQCGNLDCAVKLNSNEFDLFLRIDSNTRGNIFWYYFSVKNPHQKKRIKLNISNLTKNGTHYSKGLNPFMFSSKNNTWTQEGMSNVTFQQKRLNYDFLYERIKVEVFYELSFEFQIDSKEELRFAYCIPFSYSQLLQDLEMIKGKAEVGVLGQTLTGINIPIVMIGKHEPEVRKQVIVITGRVHPGQTNSSIMISNILKTLCFGEGLESLKENTILLIIPMINPDGVIIGNSRTGASGLDLNRQFKSKNKSLFPQIAHLKRLVQRVMQKNDLELYLDLHGHSRKKNMFIFGPPYNVTQPQYYKCRVFPKILSNITPLFRYYSCQFDIPFEKKSTARAVMLNQMFIPFVYTIQSSLGFYYDYLAHKTEAFSREKWEELGASIVTALKEYYEGMSQYEQFLQTKKRSKKNLNEDLKLERDKKSAKEIKLLKIYEEIRMCEEKKNKDDKRQKEDDQQSDSHDQEENLEKEKFYEFGKMVTEFMQEEKSKKLRNQADRPRALSRRDLIQLSPDSKKRNIELQRKRQKKWREEQQLLNEQLFAMKDLKKKDGLQPKKKHRKSQLSQGQNFSLGVQRNELSSQQIHRGLSLNQAREKTIDRPKLQPSQQFLEENADFTSGEKKANTKMNIRMFNFEKTIANHKSIRYSDGRDISKIKELNIYKNKNLSELKKRFDEKKNLEKHLKKQSFPNKSNLINLDYVDEEDDEPAQKKQEEEFIGSKAQRSKYVFPSSFYRIKYQNHKKKLEIKKNKLRNERIQEYDSKMQLKSVQQSQLATIGLLQANQSNNDLRENKKEGLFVKINRFPLL